MKDIQNPTIISGGQTGADRGGIDAAVELGLDWGGHCPAKWEAEDGEIPSDYREKLKRTKATGYKARALQNVKNAQATVIFVPSASSPSRVSELTLEYCKSMDKPVLVVETRTPYDLRSNSYMVRRFLDIHKPSKLNVAGTRESKANGIQDRVRQIIVGAFCLE